MNHNVVKDFLKSRVIFITFSFLWVHSLTFAKLFGKFIPIYICTWFDICEIIWQIHSSINAYMGLQSSFVFMV